MFDSMADRHCTMQKPNGNFCDRPSHPDAPFPICARHARIAFEFGASLARAASTSDGAPRRDLVERVVSGLPRSEPVRSQPDADPGVYFLLINGVVKIGASSSVESRIKDYPPSAEVLYVHHTPNPWVMEKQLHRRFASHLLHGQEWFASVPEIYACIEKLRWAPTHA